MKNVLKTAKKAIAVVITAALMLSLFAVMGVSAATNPTITLAYQENAASDAHFTCDINGYTGDKYIDYMQISISCSNASLKDTLLNVKDMVNSSDIDFSYAYDTLNNALVFIYEPNKAGNVYIPAGTTNLFEFDFNANSDAYSVDLMLTIDAIFCYTNGEDAEVSGNTTFFVPLRGDVNADGKVDLRDLLRYKLYLAGSSVNFRTGNADLNDDAKYNADDLPYLVEILLKG